MVLSLSRLVQIRGTGCLHAGPRGSIGHDGASEKSMIGSFIHIFFRMVWHIRLQPGGNAARTRSGHDGLYPEREDR